MNSWKQRLREEQLINKGKLLATGWLELQFNLPPTSDKTHDGEIIYFSDDVPMLINQGKPGVCMGHVIIEYSGIIRVTARDAWGEDFDYIVGFCDDHGRYEYFDEELIFWKPLKVPDLKDLTDLEERVKKEEQEECQKTTSTND